MVYLDAAADRVDERFRSSVEAARMGTVFASNRKAYDQWRRDAAPKGRGLTGDALEAAVRRIAEQFPDNVIRGTV